MRKKRVVQVWQLVHNNTHCDSFTEGDTFYQRYSHLSFISVLRFFLIFFFLPSLLFIKFRCKIRSSRRQTVILNNSIQFY